MKKIKLQMVYFLLAAINVGSRLVVFFAIRKFWLNIFNIKIGKESAIHSSVKFYHIGNFILGNNSTINHGCIIDNRKKILIGDNVNISQGTKIYTLGHDIDSETFIAKGNPVIIERTSESKNTNLVNKASVKFLLDHKRGSLAAMLNVMSDCNLNLTKIQSLPKIDTPWKYAFFVDITFKSYTDYEKGKAIMGIMAEEFKILGEYKNAKKQ